MLIPFFFTPLNSSIEDGCFCRYCKVDDKESRETILFRNGEFSSDAVICFICDPSGCALCGSCDRILHATKITKTHIRRNLQDYFDYWSNSNVFKDYNDQAPFEKDAENYAVYVSPEDCKMKLAPGFNLVMKRINRNDRPSFISAVGPTGAGKSLILRLLAKEMLKRQVDSRHDISLPIPG